MRRRRGAIAVVMLGAPLAGAVLPACSDRGPASATITVREFRFPAMSVRGGAKVVLRTADDEGHTITADDDSFSSPQAGPNRPVSFRAPTKKGTYPVHCHVHPSMHGTFTVT